MKRAFCIVLALVLMLCLASSALALSGTVRVSTWLNLRKSANTSSGLEGYMRNGTPVTIWDDGNKTNGFYRISGWSYSHHAPKDKLDDDSLWTGGATRIGWGHSDYIK